MQEAAVTFPLFYGKASDYLLWSQILFEVSGIFLNKGWAHSMAVGAALHAPPAFVSQTIERITA
jgi:hypothetical protein